MFDPYEWIAIGLAMLLVVSTIFGAGYHYGGKGPRADLATLQAQVKADKAAAKDSHDRISNANSTEAAALGVQLKVAEAQLDSAEKDRRDAVAHASLADSSLATTQRVLGFVREASGLSGYCTPGPGHNCSAQSADSAGRPDSCESTLRLVVGSSDVNNTELKRAILKRDACVTQYNGVRDRINKAVSK